MRKSIGFIALGAFLLFTLFGEAVYLYTDFLWFREIGYSGVFTKTLWIKVLLGVISGVLFFALFYVNIKLAARLRDGVVPLQSKNPEVPGPAELDPLIRRLLLPVALVLGFLAAPQAAMHWEAALLFFNGVPFGLEDPLMGKDIGFYIFRLPRPRSALPLVPGGAGVDIGGQRFGPSAVRRRPILGERPFRSPGGEDSSVGAAGVAAPGSERRLSARRLQAALLAHRGGVRRRLHGHTCTASGPARAGGGGGGGGLVLPVADAPAGAEASPDRAGRPGCRSWRRDVRLPVLFAAVSRRAQRVGGRDSLHPAQYPLHAARLRPRPGGSPGVPGRRGADRGRPQGQRRHGQEHPAVEL